ncbi:c-type cytochrome biogenesis protein CcsB [Georgenia phoenicis]|uniref:c-type cytochrome biogenesis protein CcsB n=1 Tax=unclassified Georgenia TaxID=2626815 RepID=UPI0039B04D50
MNDLGQLSLLVIYGAMAAYALAMIAFGIDLSALRDRGPAGRPRRAARIAMTTTTAGLALHALGVVTRGIAAGRVPWANMYEFTLVFTLVAVTTFLAIQRWRDLRYLGALVITPTLLALGLAVTVFYMEADGVRPALDHYWLVIHVSVATMAIGVFAVAAALSLVQLVKDRGERTAPTTHKQPAAALTGAPAGTSGPTPPGGDPDPEPVDRGFWGRLADVLPGSGELERYAYRLNAVGFLLWTFTLIAGAIWAEQTWGRPWDWDPKEVGTFVVWVVYAAYLHARATRGWDGRKAAYLGLSGFVLVLINYFVVNLFTETVHGYAF